MEVDNSKTTSYPHVLTRQYLLSILCDQSC